MKQLLTKTLQGGVKSYVTPQTEVQIINIEQSFLLSNFVGGGSGSSDIDDLGETDTDAGNAIWS